MSIFIDEETEAQGGLSHWLKITVLESVWGLGFQLRPDHKYERFYPPTPTIFQVLCFGLLFCLLAASPPLAILMLYGQKEGHKYCSVLKIK